MDRLPLDELDEVDQRHSQTLSVVDFRHFLSRRAELPVYALLLAIDVIRRSKEKNFVFFSDSMSSLQSINGFNLDSDLVQKFLKDYTVLAKNIILCWIPSHVGILGMKKQMQLQSRHSPYLSLV